MEIFHYSRTVLIKANRSWDFLEPLPMCLQLWNSISVMTFQSDFQTIFKAV